LARYSILAAGLVGIFLFLAAQRKNVLMVVR